MDKKLTMFGFFALTASMLMSADEYPAFGESGLLAVLYLGLAGILWFLPVALCSAELATTKGWESGGVYTWVKESLNQRMGFIAVFFQWLQITVNFVTMIYFIIGALSYSTNLKILNDNSWVKFCLFLVIYWGMTFLQLGGIKRTDTFVKYSFILGIIFPSAVLLILSLTYLFGGGHPMFDTNLTRNLTSLKTSFSLTTLVPYVLAFTGIEASASYINELENPKKKYPLVLVILVIFAIILDSLGGLSVATVIPVADISMNQGVIQALSLTFTKTLPAFAFCAKIIGLFMAIGMLGEISSWIVGPVTSLLKAAEDEILPETLCTLNKNSVPQRLILLQGAVVSVIAFVLTVGIGGNNTAYKMAMSFTVMLYMVTYILIFISYLKGAQKNNRTFTIPGGRIVQKVIAFVGLLTSIVIFLSTFYPSNQLHSFSTFHYMLIMVLFFGLILLLTFSIYAIGIREAKKHKKIILRHHTANEVPKFSLLKGRSEHKIEEIK